MSRFVPGYHLLVPRFVPGDQFLVPTSMRIIFFKLILRVKKIFLRILILFLWLPDIVFNISKVFLRWQNHFKVREVFLQICEGGKWQLFEGPLLAALEAAKMHFSSPYSLLEHSRFPLKMLLVYKVLNKSLNNIICLGNFIKTWQVIMVLVLYFRYLSFPSLFDNYSISQQFWQGKYSSLVV